MHTHDHALQLPTFAQHTLRMALMANNRRQEEPPRAQQVERGQEQADESRKPTEGAMRMFLAPMAKMRMMGADLLKKNLAIAEQDSLDDIAKLMEESPEYMVEDLVRQLIQVGLNEGAR